MGEAVNTALTATAVWLGSMFIYSAALKFARYDSAAKSLTQYAILPGRSAVVIGYLLPWAELIAGGLLLLAPGAAAGITSALLGASFTVASADALRRGVPAPCGCAGRNDDPVTLATSVRGVAIIVASLAVAAVSATRLPVPLPYVVMGAALAPGVSLGARRLWRHRSDRRQLAELRATIFEESRLMMAEHNF